MQLEAADALAASPLRASVYEELARTLVDQSDDLGEVGLGHDVPFPTAETLVACEPVSGDPEIPPPAPVPPAGLEPATWWVEATRSVQLSYRGAARAWLPVRRRVPRRSRPEPDAPTSVTSQASDSRPDGGLVPATSDLHPHRTVPH